MTIEKGLIINLEYKYKDRIYKIRQNFGKFSIECAEYMHTEGNYNCDCNRSLFIQVEYEDFPELDCGKEIELISMYFIE